MQRRPVVAALMALAWLPGQVRSQANWSQEAVPAYRPGHFVSGVYRHWSLPRAREFQAQATSLVQATQAWCEAPGPAQAALETVRQQWRDTVVAWERLSAVAVGPLVERRSARLVDFTPTRPSAIEHAVAAMPTTAEAMERIGTPAKGLPALEWLLWTRPSRPGSPDCRYAVQLALEIAREGAALQQAFAQAADAERGDDEVAQALDEIVNQWVGALERLRWQQIEKPIQSAEGGAAVAFPRGASGRSAAAWAAQWQALRELAVLPPGAAVPAPGSALVPLETYLRGQGLNPVADQLAGAVRQADRAMAQVNAQDHKRLLGATRAMAALKRLAEEELAPALQVSLGFSDADGD